MQVGASLFKRGALSIRARQLLDKADIPFRGAAKNGGELKIYLSMIRRVLSIAISRNSGYESTCPFVTCDRPSALLTFDLWAKDYVRRAFR